VWVVLCFGGGGGVVWGGGVCVLILPKYVVYATAGLFLDTLYPGCVVFFTSKTHPTGWRKGRISSISVTDSKGNVVDPEEYRGRQGVVANRDLGMQVEVHMAGSHT